MAKKDVNNEKKNNFSKELKSEMRKVTWPTFKELVNSTSAVISIVIIVSVIVFILDVCFENLNKFGVEKLKAFVSDETVQQEGEPISEDSTMLNTDENADGVEPEVNPTETDVNTEIQQNATGEVVQ